LPITDQIAVVESDQLNGSAIDKKGRGLGDYRGAGAIDGGSFGGVMYSKPSPGLVGSGKLALDFTRFPGHF
jgi:hypothetical protein